MSGDDGVSAPQDDGVVGLAVFPKLGLLRSRKLRIGVKYAIKSGGFYEVAV